MLINNQLFLVVLVGYIILVVVLIYTKVFSISGIIMFASIMFLWGIQTFFDWLYATSIIFKFPHLFELNVAFLYLIPPVVYLFIKSFFQYKIKFTFKDILHLIPFLSVIAFMLPFYFSSIEEKIIWSDNFNENNPAQAISHGLFYSQLVLYVYLILRYLRNLRRESETIKGVPLTIFKWFRVLSYFTLAYLVVMIIPMFFYSVQESLYIAAPINLVFFSIVSWGSIKMKFRLKEYRELEAIIIDFNKYGSQNLSKSDFEDILHIADDFLRKNRGLVNENYTLSNLAEKLQIPLCHITQALNALNKGRFYDYVLQAGKPHNF